MAQTERKFIAINDITGLHPAITEFEEMLAVPPLQMPLPQDISIDSLSTLIRHRPIPVIRSRGHYRCVGEFRLYRLAATLFEKETTVTVEVSHRRLQREKLETRYLNETFYLPALIGLSDPDVLRLYSIWSRLDAPRKDALFPSKAAFSRMLGVSTAKLRNA